MSLDDQDGALISVTNVNASIAKANFGRTNCLVLSITDMETFSIWDDSVCDMFASCVNIVNRISIR